MSKLSPQAIHLRNSWNCQGIEQVSIVSYFQPNFFIEKINIFKVVPVMFCEIVDSHKKKYYSFSQFDVMKENWSFMLGRLSR